MVDRVNLVLSNVDESLLLHDRLLFGRGRRLQGLILATECREGLFNAGELPSESFHFFQHFGIVVLHREFKGFELQTQLRGLQ